MARYDFGGVYGDVNIVENGNLYNVEVEKVVRDRGAAELLKQLREASDTSPELDDGDKQAIAAQLAAVLAELKKGGAGDSGRIEKALGVIRTAAGGATAVVALANALSPLLMKAFS
ncbi:MAG: hypothetical protein ACYDEB_05745 [Dehalococcoidia bacterium]